MTTPVHAKIVPVPEPERPDPALFENSFGDTIGNSDEVNARLAKWTPDAMLRDPWPTADIPCVGEDFEIIRNGLTDWVDHDRLPTTPQEPQR